MLSIDSVSKRYSGTRTVDAVTDVNFVLEGGRFLALTGRSGSGKSTLLGMIGGICRPTSGSVVISGTDEWQLDDNARADFRNQSVGFVFQFPSLLPNLRAIDNVALPALIGGVLNYNDAYARAHALINRVGLSERFDCYPGQLSGGEQRRVAIARALINRPQLLLADEPTADLDEQTEEEILNLLVDLHRSLNLTLVVVTHNPAIADRADQVLEMQAGLVAAKARRERQAVAVDEVPPQKASIQLSEFLESQPPDVTPEPVRLGDGIERLVGRLVVWLIPVMLLALAVNYGVEQYERSVLSATSARRVAVERLAMSTLRADVKDVELGPNGTYVVSLYLRNTTNTAPIYVLSPAVRAFVQVGGSWQEVPLRPADASVPQVLKVEGNQIFKYILEPGVHDFAQLIPYYMHVRLSNDMLVSPRSQPKDDLVERNDNYYIYLKPHDADDAAILRRLKFPGRPPVWIPMPPH